jgi:hemerythrin
MERARAHTPATGIPAIDAQVGELLGRAEALLTALRAGEGEEEVLRLLTSLEQQAIVHFASEELLMACRAYPALGPHRREHQEFRRALREAKDLFFRQGTCPGVAARLEALTDEWFVAHVTTQDALLAAFLVSAMPRSA